MTTDCKIVDKECQTPRTIIWLQQLLDAGAFEAAGSVADCWLGGLTAGCWPLGCGATLLLLYCVQLVL